MTTMHPDDKVVKISTQFKRSILFPDMNGTKILDTVNNLKAILAAHEITVRWNIMLRQREVTIPGINHFIDEKENADLAYICDLATVNLMSRRNIDAHLNKICWENTYHPIVDCIRLKPWDRELRLDKFISTVKTKDDNYSYKLIRKWMLSAIAAAFSENGFAAQGVLILQGKQGIGKTRWAKSLDPIDCNAIREGLILDPSIKDTIVTATQCWIGELGELDGTFKKSDIARLKSFITAQTDVVRLPYSRKNSRFSRRSIYIGTVNNDRFLVDETGNRRWWPIQVENIDLDHGLDMQQIWSEVYHYWLNGECLRWTLDEANLVNEKNKEHEQIDPIEETLLTMFDWSEGWQNRVTIELSCTQVLEKMGRKNPTKSDCTRLAIIIKKIAGLQSRRTNTLRIYKFPLLSSSFNSPF